MVAHVKTADFTPANRRISVCPKRFHAAWQFVGNENGRKHLHGVLIEPHKDGGVIMTATDGHTLASVRDSSGFIAGDGGWICTLPKIPFASALKRKNAGTMHFAGNAAYLTDSLIGLDARDERFDPTKITDLHLAISHAPPIDGTYPDWRAVIPQDFSTQCERISVDSKLLTRFVKAIEPMQDTKKSVGIHIAVPKDDGQPVMLRADIAPDFFGLIMPRRPTSDLSRTPHWLNLPKPKPANDAKPENVPDTDAA